MKKRTFLVGAVIAFTSIISCNNGSGGVSSQKSDDTVSSQLLIEDKPLTKEDYLKYATLTLPAYANEQYELLNSEIIPMICSQVAEKFDKDFNKILDEYTGIGGVKVKPSYADFQEAWHSNFDFNDYRNLIDKYLNEYNNTLKDYYIDYCKELDIDNISVKYPVCFAKFDIPKDDIENYVNEEMKQFYWDMADYAVDGLLILSEFVSAGTTTPLLIAKWAKTGYDVGATVDELFLDDSLEESEKLEIAIVESILLTIENYLLEEYERCFSLANNQVYNNIKMK